MKGKRAAEYAEKHKLWQKRLGDWKRGGLTQAQYCRQNNLDPRNFLYWKKKILPNSGTVSVVEIPTQVVRHSSFSANPPNLVLIIDGRFRVEVPPGFDANTLERLITFLNRP